MSNPIIPSSNSSSLNNSTSSTPFTTPQHSRRPSLSVPNTSINPLGKGQLTFTAIPQSSPTTPSKASQVTSPANTAQTLKNWKLVRTSTGFRKLATGYTEAGKFRPHQATAAQFDRIAEQLEQHGIVAALDPTVATHHISIQLNAGGQPNISINGRETGKMAQDEYIDHRLEIINNNPACIEEISPTGTSASSAPKNKTPDQAVAKASEFVKKNETALQKGSLSAQQLQEANQLKEDLTKIDTATMTQEQKTEHEKLLQKLSTTPTPSAPTSTSLIQQKYKAIAAEYLDNTKAISEEAHITTLHEMNELRGHKVDLIATPNGQAWSLDESSPHALHRADIPCLRQGFKPGKTQFTAVPLILDDNQHHALLVIDTDRNVYLYAPTKIRNQATVDRLKNLLTRQPNTQVREIKDRETRLCTDDTNSAIYCANFFEYVCDVQQRNESAWFKKKIDFTLVPVVTSAAEKRQELAELNQNYLSNITTQTQTIVNESKALKKVESKRDIAIRQVDQSNLTILPTIPASFAENPSFKFQEVSKTALEAALETGLANRVVIGENTGALAKELAARTPLIPNQTSWHHAVHLPILREGQQLNFKLIEANQPVSKVDSVLSMNTLTLKESDWSEGALTPQAKDLLQNHIYRQMQAAVRNKPKGSNSNLFIDPPAFYTHLHPIRKMAIQAVYASVLSHADFAAKIGQVYLCESTLQADTEALQQSITQLANILQTRATKSEEDKENIHQCGQAFAELQQQKVLLAHRGAIFTPAAESAFNNLNIELNLTAFEEWIDAVISSLQNPNPSSVAKLDQLATTINDNFNVLKTGLTNLTLNSTQQDRKTQIETKITALQAQIEAARLPYFETELNSYENTFLELERNYAELVQEMIDNGATSKNVAPWLTRIAALKKQTDTCLENLNAISKDPIPPRAKELAKNLSNLSTDLTNLEAGNHV